MGQNQYKPFKNEPNPNDPSPNQPNPPNNQPIPNQQMPLNPFMNPYGYQENMGANYFLRNPNNEKNRIYISRSCFGEFISKQFSPALTFNRLNAKEFEEHMEEINKIAFRFRFIKCLYILMTIFIVFSLVIFIVGLFLNPEFSYSNYYEQYFAQYMETQDIAYNVLTGCGVILLILSVVVLLMAVVCTLKKYEFLIAKYLNQINRDNYLTRNVFWKVGSFCRFLEINILPIQPEFLWFLQTEQGQQIEINNIKQILKA